MSSNSAQTDSAGPRKRKKSSYYKSNKKFYSNKNTLSEGMNGFVVTCNLKEFQCLRETYNLLNEFSDKLYGNYNKDNESPEKEIDIETAVEKEIKALNTSEKRFQQVITKCNNVLFIKSNDKAIDPTLIGEQILKEIESNGKQLTQHLLRFIPIVITCKPLGTNFEQLIESNLEKQTKDSISFVIQCKVRNNSDVKRLPMIESVVNIVKKVRPQWTVDFKEPKLTINLEVLQKTCCISFLNDYNYYCKYNLIEFSKKVFKQIDCNKKDKNSAIV